MQKTTSDPVQTGEETACRVLSRSPAGAPFGSVIVNGQPTEMDPIDGFRGWAKGRGLL